jgi:hypothetical protein
VLTFSEVAFVDETRDDVRILEIAKRSSKRWDSYLGRYCSTHKLSCFPKTLVGIADVKLSPNSSL